MGPGGWAGGPGMRDWQGWAQFVAADVGVEAELAWAMRHLESCGKSQGRQWEAVG